MKLVLATIVGLLFLSLGYLSLAQKPIVNNQVISNPESALLVTDTQCTSTACMKAEAGVLSAGLGKSETNFHLNSYTEFVNPSGFVNSEPFSMSDYIGKKVILVEFITYSCINCQRTFPYMQAWHETYKNDGLLVIGIHTPEFAYERNRDNVIVAMEKQGITFPIVLDNEYETWKAYKNRFWPHRYVIDYDGQVVFDHIGEGAYRETEEIIKQLLANKPKAAPLETER